MMANRTGRKRSQLPDCYYEGYLEKKSLKDQTSQKLWTCLCGSTLFFFHEKRDVDYVDKVDLSALVSVEDDHSSDSTVDSARFTVQLQSGSIKFTAPNSECRELWKGFIHAVGQLSVPSSLNLLPGQIHMMGDAVQKEQERRANIHYSPAVHRPPASTPSDMPACFFEVPRLEAELLLEREASKGNLLVRPRRSQNSYAISTRMEISGAVFKHYRVLRRESGGFYIDVENPVFGDTLQDVVDYLVEKTNGSLTPLIIEEQYDKKLSFIVSDNESGEKTQQPLPQQPLPQQPLPQQPLPQQPLPQQPLPQQLLPQQPLPQQPLPNFVPRAAPRKHVEEKSTTSEAKPAGEEYFAFTDHATPKKALIPPSPAPRKGSVTSSTNLHGDSRKSSSTEDHKKTVLSPSISELKLRLGQKLKIYEV